MIRLKHIIELLSFVALIGVGTSAAASPNLWTVDATPNARLGVAFPGSNTRYYSLLADLGVGVVRLSASWDRLEPQRGQYNYSGLDDRIRALQSYGIEPFLTFESTASWAVQTDQSVKNATPVNMQDWADFTGRVTERYDGDGLNDMPGLRAPVRFFQVANEFNSPTNRSGGWAGSHDDLVTYINTAHGAVKNAYGDAVFVLGGVAAFNADIALLDTGRASFTLQQKWSATSQTIFNPADLRTAQLRDLIDNRFMRVLRDARYDWASVHLYGPEGRDGARFQMMRDLTQRPVISTECGGPSLDYGQAYSGHAHFRAALERNLNVQAAGAPFCLWFGLGEGITSTYGNSRVQLYDARAREKPGVVAYRLLSRLLTPDARVTQPMDGLYVVRSGQQIACITTNTLAHEDAPNICTSMALCVIDAQTKQVISTDTLGLANACPNTGIGLSGDLFWSALENGN